MQDAFLQVFMLQAEYVMISQHSQSYSIIRLQGISFLIKKTGETTKKHLCGEDIDF